MSRVCLEAEKSYDTGLDRDARPRFTRIDQSIAMAAIWTAYHPQGQGDRLAHPDRLDRAVDEPPDRRRADLRAHPEVSGAQPDDALPRGPSAADEPDPPGPRRAAVGGGAGPARAGAWSITATSSCSPSASRSAAQAAPTRSRSCAWANTTARHADDPSECPSATGDTVSVPAHTLK